MKIVLKQTMSNSNSETATTPVPGATYAVQQISKAIEPGFAVQQVPVMAAVYPPPAAAVVSEITVPPAARVAVTTALNGERATTTTAESLLATETVPNSINKLKQSPSSDPSTTSITKKRKGFPYLPPKVKPVDWYKYPSFGEMLYKLMAYRCRHGHVRVPNSERQLGPWTVLVRRIYASEYRKLVGNKDGMTGSPEKTPGAPTAVETNAVGLNLLGTTATTTSPSVAGADKLKIPPKKFTNCTPTAATANCYLNEERVAVLDSIGFPWTLATDTNERRWEEQYFKLVQYKEKHGDCLVPQSTALGKWVQMQRDQFKERQRQEQGIPTKRSVIPANRVAKLNALGFAWRCREEAVGWEGRFQELILYNNQYGNCNVPQGWKPNVQLGRWVMKQVSCCCFVTW